MWLRHCANMLLCLARQQQDEQWQDRLKRMGARAAGKRPWPGCTALAMLIKDDRMLVANAGDINQLKSLSVLQKCLVCKLCLVLCCNAACCHMFKQVLAWIHHSSYFTSTLA